MDWSLAITIASFLTGVFIVLGIGQRNVARVQDRRIEEPSQGGRGGGANHPIAQHPQVKPYSRLGYSSCVGAFPEQVEGGN